MQRNLILRGSTRGSIVEKEKGFYWFLYDGEWAVVEVIGQQWVNVMGDDCGCDVNYLDGVWGERLIPPSIEVAKGNLNAVSEILSLRKIGK